MPVNITDTDTYTATVQAPDDGDAAVGAVFQLAPQGLANRTKYLKTRLEEFFMTGAAQDILVPPGSFVLQGAATGQRSNNGGQSATHSISANSGEWAASIDHLLREGTVINSLKVRVNPGANTATGTDTMAVGIRVLAFDPTTGAFIAEASMNAVAPTQAADSSGAAQTLSYDPGDTPVTFLTGTPYRLSYEVVVRGASTAGSSTDYFGGVILDITHPALP